MKTILVTGASGFVGTHTLKALSEIEGIHLIAACRDKQKLRIPFAGEVREGDMRDDNYLRTLLDGVDVVVNAVAWSSLWGRKDISERLFLKPNVKLIEAFFNSQAQRYVNISSTSAAVPGDSANAMSEGGSHPYWPHLDNVVKIENALKYKLKQQRAGDHKQVINMRLGLFAGEHYALGLLPILVPRMKTHLVPWVAGGKTEMPIIDGRDIGQAMMLAATRENLNGYESFNVVGPEVPSVRQVIEFIANQYSLPKPHFSVPFVIAYPFAWCMETLDRWVPWEPLIVRSIIHLLENTGADNHHAEEVLGYQPQYDWRLAIQAQMQEMSIKQKSAMKMAVPIA